ncbi:MAG: hypothetical protein LBI38_01400 [Oscillospiraceae bacterium]|jgi:hypothetical protein|nr:hypothetical protein [Oscillospiraceae bacterium]
MGYKIVGAICVLAGAAIIAAGIAYVSSADGKKPPKSGAVYETGKGGFGGVEAGLFFLDGDSEKGCIRLFGDGTFAIDGGERQEYLLKIWKDIPVTCEESGRITLTDIYYLGTNLDGGFAYSEKIEYDYANSRLVYGDKAYLRAEAA